MNIGKEREIHAHWSRRTNDGFVCETSRVHARISSFCWPSKRSVVRRVTWPVFSLPTKTKLFPCAYNNHFPSTRPWFRLIWFDLVTRLFIVIIQYNMSGGNTVKVACIPEKINISMLEYIIINQWETWNIWDDEWVVLQSQPYDPDCSGADQIGKCWR